MKFLVVFINNALQARDVVPRLPFGLNVVILERASRVVVVLWSASLSLSPFTFIVCLTSEPNPSSIYISRLSTYIRIYIL